MDKRCFYLYGDKFDINSGKNSNKININLIKFKREQCDHAQSDSIESLELRYRALFVLII